MLNISSYVDQVKKEISKYIPMAFNNDCITINIRNIDYNTPI